MKLYGYYRSSASYRIRILLNYKGLEWEYAAILLNRDEHLGRAFRALNPAGFVPVLDTGAALLGETPAIAEFLEEQYPSPPLLPDDPLRRAQVRELQSLIGCDIHPLQNLRVLKHLRAEYGLADDAVTAWCRKWIEEGFRAYEALTRGRSTAGRFSVGDMLTLADAWLVPQAYNARRFGVDLAPFPTIVSIVEHCETLEPVAAAHPSRQPDSP
jgi:maleylpyruvate isomerase